MAGSTLRSTNPRPHPPAFRVVERELRFFRITWKGTSFSTFAAPLLMLVALGIGLGEMIGSRPSLGGVDYLDFLAPGLMVGVACQMGSGMALWPVMAGHRWIGHHRAMVATPIGPRQLAAGYLSWVTLRALMQASVFCAVAAVLGGVASGWAVLAPPVAAFAAAAFCAPLMAFTARADSDGPFDPILRVFVTPLYLFSGSFFPISQLPDALQWVARLFPMWHGIELARAATTGIALAPAVVVVHLAVIGLWVAVGFALARRAFVARLTP